MKTRQEMCVLILCLMAILLLCSPAQAAQDSHSTPPPRQASGQTVDPNSITGEWQGMVASLHLIVKIEQVANGGFIGKLTIVDQGNATVPIETVTLRPARKVRLELKSAGAVYEGKLSDNAKEITGTWQQGGNSAPVVLRRPGAAAAAFTLKPRTLGRVAFQPCRTADGNVEGLCGKYEVYEDRKSQSGRKISLNIMVLPAVSENPLPDPFFAIAGGPGQSAVEAFPLAGFITRVRQQRDVVLVDQRGTGGSNPLPCVLRDPKDAQAVIDEGFPVERVRACRAELEKKADLKQYTTSIAIDDLDEVRQAMGYGKINIFGGSYGSRAALVYLRRHGDQVRTLALEAVAPPTYSSIPSFARTLQNSVTQIIDRCAADPACHKDFPDLKKEFQELVDRLEKSPAHFNLKTSTGTQAVTLSRGTFVNDLRHILYIPELVSQFPYIIHRAYQGDWSIYGAAAVAIDNLIEKTLDRGMSLSVICAEDMHELTEEAIQRDTAGTWLGDYRVRLLQKACPEWPGGAVPRDYRARVRSAVPALLISGALDPATPPSQSAQAAQDLSNSRVVVVKEGTHGTGSPCVDTLISQFVDQGSAKELDVSCTDQIHLPPFFTQEKADQLRQAAAKN